jgi:hypothetical protein
MYKFIGTDEQLIKNGFTLIKGDPFFKAKRSYKGYQVSVDHDNSFGTFSKWYLNHMIKKGLVIEVKK